MKKEIVYACLGICMLLLFSCSQNSKNEDETVSPFAGTWINNDYNGSDGRPSAKIVISQDGLSWTGYNNVTDTTSIATITVINEGDYSGDVSWTKFTDGWYRLLKVSGNTLYFNLDSTSYDAAFSTTTKNYSYTKD
jgi:hypothetical protein